MKVQRETRKRLKVYAAETGQDYDSAINDLLDQADNVD